MALIMPMVVPLIMMVLVLRLMMVKLRLRGLKLTAKNGQDGEKAVKIRGIGRGPVVLP